MKYGYKSNPEQKKSLNKGVPLCRTRIMANLDEATPPGL